MKRNQTIRDKREVPMTLTAIQLSVVLISYQKTISLNLEQANFAKSTQKSFYRRHVLKITNTATHKELLASY